MAGPFFAGAFTVMGISDMIKGYGFNSGTGWGPMLVGLMLFLVGTGLGIAALTGLLLQFTGIPFFITIPALWWFLCFLFAFRTYNDKSK